MRKGKGVQKWDRFRKKNGSKMGMVQKWERLKLEMVQKWKRFRNGKGSEMGKVQK